MHPGQPDSPPPGTPPTSQPLPWWLRAYLLVGAVETLFVGGKGFLLPEQIPLPLQVSPLNARFTAALYLAAAVALTISACMRYREDTRIFVGGFSLAVTLVSVVTLLNWADFTASPRAGALWVGLYALDVALAALLALPIVRLFAGFRPTRHALTPLFVVEGAVLGGVGLLLLFAPALVAIAWPWTIPPLVARLYGCFFLAFALCALLAAGETRPTAIRNVLVFSLALTLLVLLASVLHLPRFRPDATTWLWFGLFGAGAVAFGLAFLARQRRGQVALPTPPAAS
jgi:hypothetical protein